MKAKNVVNRCFNKVPSEKTREEENEKKVKEFLLAKAERKRANQAISDLLKLSGGSLIKILPAIQRRYPKYVLAVLVERIEKNQWDKLTVEDQICVLRVKESLKKEGNA